MFVYSSLLVRDCCMFITTVPLVLKMVQHVYHNVSSYSVNVASCFIDGFLSFRECHIMLFPLVQEILHLIYHKVPTCFTFRDPGALPVEREWLNLVWKHTVGRRRNMGLYVHRNH